MDGCLRKAPSPAFRQGPPIRMKHPFTHCHCHSEFSLWDGVAQIPQMVRKTAEFGMEHLALTDHGTMGGAIKFYEECKRNSVKPIIGMEGYFCNNMHSRDKSNYYHLILLAKNNTGYNNLMKLVSKSNIEGKYKKPRFDFKCLSDHSEGLIVSSACILGELAQNILHKENGVEEAKNVVKRFKDLFGKDYYLEVMYQGTPGDIEPLSEDTKKLMVDQQTVINSLYDISKKLDTKMIVTNDVHYVCQEDYISRYMKMRIGSWSTDDTSDNDFGDSNKADDSLDYHLKSPEAMWAKWGEYFPDALTNTYEIGEQCNIEIPLLSLGDNIGSRMPYFKIPEDEGFNIYLDSDRSNAPLDVKYVKYLTIKGLKEKGLDNKQEYINRLKHELAVIGSNPSFCTYFLITRDFVQFAKNSGIYVGPGRGSAGGSLVMHLLGVTLPDPIEHGLDFERFLSADKAYQTTMLDYL